MEVLSSSFASNPIDFSSFTSKFPRRACYRKILYRFRTPVSNFHKARPSQCYLSLAGSRNFQISARSGETSRRRNSLRKKLIDDQKLRIIPNRTGPGTDFHNPDVNFRDKLIHGNDTKNDVFVESISAEKLENKILGDSNLLNELENWVTQYKKEAAYWGIGSNPIFTVFKDLDGNVKKVKVDEDEIMRRSQELEDLTKVNSKIQHAKKLAEEMENGKNVISRNSSVAKFILPSEESNFISTVRGVILRHDLIPKLSVIGRAVFCGFLVFWVAKIVLFAFGTNKEMEYTEMEKEMMRRKMKARKEKEMVQKGTVEVLVEDLDKPLVPSERPKLDEQELMSSISKVKGSKNKFQVLDSSMNKTADEPIEFDNKIREIRKMARRAREIEAGNRADMVGDEKQTPAVNEEVVEDNTEESLSFLNNVPDGENGIMRVSAEAREENSKFRGSVVSIENGIMQSSTSSSLEVKSIHNMSQKLTANESSISLHILETEKTFQSSEVFNGKASKMKNGSVSRKPRVIKSVKEAKEFLSRKRGEKELSQEPLQKTLQKTGTPESTMASNSYEKYSMFDKNFLPNKKDDSEYSESASVFTGEESLSINDGNHVNSQEGNEMCVHQSPRTSDYELTDTEQPVKSKNWVEKSFHEFEPIVKKIGDGFRDSYMVAREKISQGSSTKTDITQLGSYEDDSELEWMKDDKLRDIVFRVRDNELAGRDPFYLMDSEDKVMFFNGLEKKVEKENEKLSQLHEWLHSNIENLDYGADGISLYDPPEKIIPRWKGPPLEKNPDFLNNYHGQRKALFSEKAATSFPAMKEEQNTLQKPAESTDNGNLTTSSGNNNAFKSKTVIEGSDGSIRPGKKSGKEFWQHTKKWSSGFLELYNSETDPEVKAAMKDMGKDLDRWITQEEIQEAADLMNKLPERNKKFMEKKINKLKREMELFGPQAVVSKYREYGEEKEEDYLWWLDLPHVLCIEMYTVENGEQRVGFYALEMATDLELEPKPHHVIAFEDAADCKNFHCIIETHLEMLANGNAFIVPRPPKDAFREAKANGFGVTVIRKGELKLNVDQTLEEVEEQICEIGSQMYHDQIMKDRSVDISSLMKGVFGLKSKPGKRKRSKRMLKSSSKQQS